MTAVFIGGSQEVLSGQRLFMLKDAAKCMECGMLMGDTQELRCVDDLFRFVSFRFNLKRRAADSAKKNGT